MGAARWGLVRCGWATNGRIADVLGSEWQEAMGSVRRGVER